MEYLIAILLIVFYLGYYVFSGNLTKEEISSYLEEHELRYSSHKMIYGDKQVKKMFKEDANPFLFKIYKVQYYKIVSTDLDENQVDVYAKWYRRNTFLFKSKGFFKRP